MTRFRHQSFFAVGSTWILENVSPDCCVSKEEINNILGKCFVSGLKLVLVVNEVQPHLRRVRVLVVGDGDTATVLEAKVGYVPTRDLLGVADW